jgi:hypothetical protein
MSVIDSERLTRQFAFATNLAVKVSIKAITYPRTLRALPVVRAAILADLARGPGSAS